MASTFWTDQLAAAKSTLAAYQAAQLAIIAGGIESYTIDTGQSVQKVTKLNIDVLDRQIDALLNRIATLEARCTGSGVFIGSPGF